MGQSKSSLSSRRLSEITNATTYSEDEVQTIYKTFLKDCPSGKLCEKEFKEIYSKISPHGDSSEFAEHVFRSYDVDKSGSIDFREFMVGIYMMSRGTFDEKLEWSYRLFDRDNDGQVTKGEMLEILTSMYKMIGHVEMSRLVADGLTAEERMERIFSRVDQDGDITISFEEFRKAAWEDRTIVSLLQLREAGVALSTTASMDG